MRTVMIAVLLAGLFFVGGVQHASATNHEVNGSERFCFMNVLPEETRLQVKEILAEFRTEMAALRAQIAQQRESGDRDGLAELRNQGRELKQEMREEIAALLPEEYREQYLNRKHKHCRRYQPANRPARGEGPYGGGFR